MTYVGKYVLVKFKNGAVSFYKVYQMDAYNILYCRNLENTNMHKIQKKHVFETFDSLKEVKDKYPEEFL